MAPRLPPRERARSAPCCARHEAPGQLPQAPPRADGPGARARRHQPDLLAARSADPALLDRHLRDALRGVHARRVLPRRWRPARRRHRRRLRLARRQELPGLLHQRGQPAGGRAHVRRRGAPRPRGPLPRLRGSAQRRDPGPPAEGARRRREAAHRHHQHAVHLAGRRAVRADLRRHRPLADRAGLPRRLPRRRHHQHDPLAPHQAPAEGHRRRDLGAGRRHHRVAAQHRAGQEPRPGPAGGRPPRQGHRQGRRPRAQEGPHPARPELHPGHHREPRPRHHRLLDAVPALRPPDQHRPVLLPPRLLVLHLRPAAGAGEHHQPAGGGRGLAAHVRGVPAHPQGAAPRQPASARPPRGAAVPGRVVPARQRGAAGAHRHRLPRRPRRDHRLRRALGRRQEHAGQAAGRPVPPAPGPDPLQRRRPRHRRSGEPARAHRPGHPGHPAVLRHHPREPPVRARRRQR